MYKRLFITVANAEKAKALLDSHVTKMPNYDMALQLQRLAARVRSEMLLVIPDPRTGQPRKKLTRFLFTLNHKQGSAMRLLQLALPERDAVVFDLRAD